MLDIEKVKGILIAPDGSFRLFGVHSDAPVRELTDINFHDSAFKMELSESDWFKELRQKYDLDYNDTPLMRQGMAWASKGFILFIHAGAKPVDAYCVLVPEDMSLEQTELFKENYDNLHDQIDGSESYFEGYIFDGNSNYAKDGMVFGLDAFYERMGISRGSHAIKH